MKHIIPILILPVLFLTACSQSTRNAKDSKTDTVSSPSKGQSVTKVLFATMKIRDNIKVGDSIKLRFTVYNPTDSVMQFCKWHTPFEPLMSKYLDVKDEKGEEVSYKGAMAKRMMPPPASSYIQVKAGDSLSVDVDMLKAYAITQPAKYTISYNGQSMSGLVLKDSVTFVYAAK
ncbi:protease [Pedobacter sp. L105]|uniref:protease n=1 Tax=Pedobacter sp. L105 TaxID=1641871 RepID=UPI00131A767B|nr:protease [Pedobacter sp. L105]